MAAYKKQYLYELSESLGGRELLIPSSYYYKCLKCGLTYSFYDSEYLECGNCDVPLEISKEYDALVEATKNLTDEDCKAIMRGEKPYKSKTIKAVAKEIKKLEEAAKCKWHKLPLSSKGKCPKQFDIKDRRHPLRTIQRLSEAYRKEFGKKIEESEKWIETFHVKGL